MKRRVWEQQTLVLVSPICLCSFKSIVISSQREVLLGEGFFKDEGSSFWLAHSAFSSLYLANGVVLRLGTSPQFYNTLTIR